MKTFGLEGVEGQGYDVGGGGREGGEKEGFYAVAVAGAARASFFFSDSSCSI